MDCKDRDKHPKTSCRPPDCPRIPRLASQAMPINATPLCPEQRRSLFEQFLRCLDREENLIHYRLTWGAQWNIACFAALFALKSGGVEISILPYIEIVLVVFGFSSSILSLIAILAAHQQTTYLIEQLNKRLQVGNHDWDSTEFIRPYGDPTNVHRSARRVSAFFPLLFIVLWFFVFLYALPSLIKASASPVVDHKNAPSETTPK